MCLRSLENDSGVTGGGGRAKDYTVLSAGRWSTRILHKKHYTYGRGTSPRHGSSSRHPAYKLPFARRVETIYAQD